MPGSAPGPGAQTGRRGEEGLRRPAREQLLKLWRRLRGGDLSRSRAAGSIAVGLFVAALPLYGFQLALVLLICVPLRLDAAVAYVAAHVSNPLTLPLLVAAEIEIGSLMLLGRHATLPAGENLTTQLSAYAVQLLVGAPLLGLCLAALGSAITLIVARPGDRAVDARLARAIHRTRARYAFAPPAPRLYIDNKLLNDPIFELLTRDDSDLGTVVDAGCGFGQVGLCLLEGGYARSLHGFDANPDRIALAERAANLDASFRLGRLDSEGWPEADTVLLLDVLHYLDGPSQDRALRAAAASLSQNGRLYLRAPRTRSRWRSRMTRMFERIAILSRRQPRAVFREAAHYAAVLQAAGLRCQHLDTGDWGPFDNFAMRATKR